MRQRLFLILAIVIFLYPSAATANDNGVLQAESVFQGHEPIGLDRFRQIVETALSRPDMRGTLAGFKVVDLGTGRTLFDFNGNVLLHPASNMKIVTTSAALYALGPGYRFTTSVRTTRLPNARGTLRGDLCVIGRGDPLLTHENLERMAADIHETGLRTIRGNLVIDDSFFDQVRQIPGWDNDKDQNCYSAPMGALSVQFNTVWISIHPSRRTGRKAVITTIPETRYFRIRNRVKTVRKGSTQISIKMAEGRRAPWIIIQGKINRQDRGGIMTCRKIDHPAAYAGRTLYDYLLRQGIRLRGQVKIRTLKNAAGHHLLTFHSPPLEQIIYQLNKESNNFMAEQIFKTLGAEKMGPPGTWDNGILAVGEFLSQVVGAKEGSYDIQNGSGLGMDNRLSPDLLVRVLRFMYTHPDLKNAFFASLPVMGVDGTLRNRHKNSDASHRIIAKTGLLNDVRALSGYVETKGCDKLVFSLLLNRLTPVPDVDLRKVQDEIILAMSNLTLNPAHQNCEALRPMTP